MTNKERTEDQQAIYASVTGRLKAQQRIVEAIAELPEDQRTLALHQALSARALTTALEEQLAVMDAEPANEADLVRVQRWLRRATGHILDGMLEIKGIDRVIDISDCIDTKIQHALHDDFDALHAAVDSAVERELAKDRQVHAVSESPVTVPSPLAFAQMVKRPVQAPAIRVSEIRKQPELHYEMPEEQKIVEYISNSKKPVYMRDMVQFFFETPLLPRETFREFYAVLDDLVTRREFKQLENGTYFRNKKTVTDQESLDEKIRTARIGSGRKPKVSSVNHRTGRRGGQGIGRITNI